MNVAIITQARTSSTRLPEKIIKDVCGKSLLEHHLDRLRRVRKASEVIVATTEDDGDDRIVTICEKMECRFHRGPMDDVLTRFYQSAVKYDVDVIVRVTSDCPLIDPSIVDRVITYFIENQARYDYVSNTLVRTYPRGMDTEIFPRDILEAAYTESTTASDREHVTPFIWQNPTRFRLGSVTADRDLSNIRLTVDTRDDLELIQKIFAHFNGDISDCSIDELITVLEHNPDWLRLNAHVPQKGLPGRK